jgi:hypothetical protein
VISEVLNASLSIATPATNVRIFPTLAITWPQRVWDIDRNLVGAAQVNGHVG